MKQRTKDIIIIYIGIIMFFVILLGLSSFFQDSNDMDNMSSSSYQEQKVEEPVVYDTPVKNPAKNVEVINQLPEFPSGDEFAATTSFLNAYGYSANIYSLLNYMNYDATNYVECYVGDARTNTGYCYAPALVICINNYLSDIDARIRVYNSTGLHYEALKEYVSNGEPMIVWYTSDGNMPEYNNELYKNHFRTYTNQQVIVVYNIEKGIVEATDSLNGYISIQEDEFQRIWEASGSQCIGAYYKN